MTALEKHMTIDVKNAPIEEVKQFAKDQLGMRIAHNASDEKVREKVLQALSEKATLNTPDVAPDVAPEVKEPLEKSAKLDRTKPYGDVRGEPGVAYFQFGKMFNVGGEEV
jgi:hypothetical protein